MTTAGAVPKEARSVSQEWLQLAAATAAPAAFDPEMTAGLPPAARAWLAHAIEPGTRLRPTVELTMPGQIRLGRWRSLAARQILAPPHGYIWAATARVAGLPVSGFDRLSSGTGEVSWRLLRLVPVMAAAGPDITRSAAGRMAGEIALLPTAHLHAVKDALAPWHARYDYYNFEETPATAAAVLPPASARRLQQIKAAHDPDQVIISAHPAWPARPRPDAPRHRLP